MIIINNVQEYRKNMGLTQEELANRAGVSRKTINSLEKGNYTPSLLLAFQIAKVLEVGLTEIFELNDEQD